jgi:hypothetical protein
VPWRVFLLVSRIDFNFLTTRVFNLTHLVSVFLER